MLLKHVAKCWKKQHMFKTRYIMKTTRVCQHYFANLSRCIMCLGQKLVALSARKHVPVKTQDNNVKTHCVLFDKHNLQHSQTKHVLLYKQISKLQMKTHMFVTHKLQTCQNEYASCQKQVANI